MVAAFIHWCRPVTDRLVANYDEYWQRYRWLTTATCVAAFADLLTTIRFMYADGIEYELHPGIRIAAQVAGPLIGPLFGKLAQLAGIFLVTLYARRIALYVFVATTMMYGWAAWYNVWGRDLYSPMLFELLPLHW